MEYYVEYIFAENFIIDFILLYITGSLLRKKIYYRRLIAASLTGAAYVILTVWAGEGFLAFFPVKISISVLMVIISFNPNKWISGVRAVLCFYIVTLTSVGVIGSLYFFTGSTLTVNIILLSLFACFAILKFFFYEMKARREMSGYMRTVTIGIGDKTQSLTAYVDTGNDLQDPMTGKPVMIVNIESIKGLLGEDVTKEILEFYESKSYTGINPDRLEELKLRVIRYNTISSKGELMMCIVPDSMIIAKDGKTVNADAVIGIFPKRLSKFRDYDALLFKKLLDWENENECEYC